MVWARKPRTHKIWYIARLTVRDLRLTSRENDNAKLRNSQTGETDVSRGGTAMAERTFAGEATQRARLAGPALVDDSLSLSFSKS